MSQNFCAPSSAPIRAAAIPYYQTEGGLIMAKDEIWVKDYVGQSTSFDMEFYPLKKAQYQLIVWFDLNSNGFPDSDEPSVLDYNTDFKTPNLITTLYAPDQFRVSDHDPVLVGLNLINYPPTVDAGGPYTVTEGGSIVVSATGADPEGGPVAYAWDLNGNGSFETPGQSATFSPGANTAPATLTIKVQATDAFGNSSVDEATVYVIFNWTGFFQPIDATGNRPHRHPIQWMALSDLGRVLEVGS